MVHTCSAIAMHVRGVRVTKWHLVDNTKYSWQMIESVFK